MPANSRWDLIRRLRVKEVSFFKGVEKCIDTENLLPLHKIHSLCVARKNKGTADLQVSYA